MVNRLITVTADDFGQSTANNKGVLAAHQAGIVDRTSLMVGGSGLEEALDIARQNPGLAVGLHICLSDGTPVSRPMDIPLLIQSDGRFPPNEQMLHGAVRSAAGRAQIRSEIAAQFQKFFDTGLTCNHVDVHRHTHRHPIVANEVFRAAASRHIRKMRIPYDPAICRRRRLTDSLRYARAVALRRLAAHYGLTWIDRVIGRNWSDPLALTELITKLPAGSTELYFHPVVCEGDHMFKADLAVLLDERVRRVLTRGVLRN